ncbi:MAG: amino acid transporter [Chloroflexi bacterium]|nr:MAG: amino acid transporter [Chloroflexota bacterium]
MGEFWAPLVQGFGLGAALIVAIGAQNAFVLQQGLKRRHVFATALVCTLCDALLIVLGVAGLGTLIAHSQAMATLATWGGVLFLLAYGLRAFRSALRPAALDADQSKLEGATLRATVLAVLGVSLLNPHVYLDTVVLVGSVGAGHVGVGRLAFATGAALASFTWFFGLAYGSAWLAPLFRRPVAWRVLDLAVGVIMWAIAASFVLSKTA